MKIRLIYLFLLLLLSGLSLAEDKDKEEEKPKPKPDLWAAEIQAPEGLMFGPNNSVKVIVENLIKDTEIAGPVKVELVVIQPEEGGRQSYFAEVEGMRQGQKREAVFQGVEAKSRDKVRLLAIVDPEKTVEESNEDNNRRLYQVSIKSPKVSPTPEPETEESVEETDEK